MLCAMINFVCLYVDPSSGDLEEGRRYTTGGGFRSLKRYVSPSSWQGGWRSVFTVGLILIELVDVVQEFRPAEVDTLGRSLGRKVGTLSTF